MKRRTAEREATSTGGVGEVEKARQRRVTDWRLSHTPLVLPPKTVVSKAKSIVA